jgi:3-hydroxyacyl-CoA dehydrogenase
MDQIGLDLMLQTMSNARFVEGDEVWAPLIARIEPLVAQGNLGVKTGQGFFEYPNSKPN